ncbi:probable ATP-dependent RNA helicase DDX52 [Liolophura sinensis]|uniref:probable ATP-dependent RNA helicase DDX52 n=1 Tax=Liolophura sinensis TaxID=3198878 RepID=UPI0031587048
MDGFDLFKKLGVGAKFDYKRFQKDAEQLKLVQPKCSQKDVTKALDFFGDSEKTVQKIESAEDRLSTEESGQSESSEEEDSSHDGSHDSDSQSEAELQLLGNIISKGKQESIHVSKKRKKKGKSPQKIAALKQEEVNHLRNKHRIHVYGSDIPDPVVTFDQLTSRYGVNSRLIKNLVSAGYKDLTAVQMQAVPVMLQRREIMGCAPTGSGKTAAFIIPVLHHLKGPRSLGFRAVVLAPTRELAKQTCRWFQRLSEGLGLRIHYIEKASTAAKKFGPKSSQKFDVLVATPNRLVYLLQQDPPLIQLKNVEWLIVDESDKLFEEGQRGFRDQLAVIYKACDNNNIRRAMFSATFASDVEQWCKLNLDNVVQVHVGARNVCTESVEQELLFVGGESGKLIALREIFRKGVKPPVLIFVQAKDRAKELFHELIYDGLNVDVIHSDRTQLQRDNVVKCFRAGTIWVLICTELMGRGIDFQGVNLVINYDFPNSAVSYIHRIGRTGRAGRGGKAITFFTQEDAVNLRSIANIMREAGCSVPEYMLTLKRPSRNERKKLSRQNPVRENISTMPEDKVRDRKRRNYLKRRRLEAKAEVKSSAEKRTKLDETEVIETTKSVKPLKQKVSETTKSVKPLQQKVSGKKEKKNRFKQTVSKNNKTNSRKDRLMENTD